MSAVPCAANLLQRRDPPDRTTRMKADSVRAIIDALKQAQARYLIVGGLAVVAHGYVRYTVDVDLVLALDAENVRRSMKALASLGYYPRVPVRLEDFANAELRERWIREKGMIVFQLVSEAHLETPVDVFVTSPFDFEWQVQRAVWLPLLGAKEAPFLALDELLHMKKEAGRAKDMVDIDELKSMHQLPPDFSR